MKDEAVTGFFAKYGLAPVRLLPIQKGYRNESHPAELADGQRVNLIIYKSEAGILPRIRRANAVADYLAGQGMPARRTADSRILQIAAPGGRQKYAALYLYLTGKTIPWEAYTQKHLKALGQAMGDMHGFLQVYPAVANGLPPVAEEYLEILARMRRYFADPAVAGAMRAKLGVAVPPTVPTRLRRVLGGCATLPGQQPLHMDFVRGNVLFDPQANIAGILDFEKTAQGHPLFDIARTLAFLLVDCKHKPEAKVRKYFVQSGYNKRGRGAFKVGDSVAPLLEQLVDLFLLHDFYKFLRHNPYEFLHLNEHYTRTAAQLVQRGALTLTPRA